MQAITVKELIKALKEENPNAMVAIATDSEGNSYSLVPREQFITTNVYMGKELGTQESYFEAEDVERHDDKTVADFYGNPHDKKKLARAVILWPSN